jgi:hypothetical protein
MLKEIIFGISLLTLTAGAGIGIGANCKREIDQHFPLVQQNFSEAKAEFERGNYDKVREIRRNTGKIILDLDEKGGEWYYLFFPKGMQIYSMYQNIKNLETSTQILEKRI